MFSGWLLATLFLGIKCLLYDVQEYEADLFSILQLSRDYLNGKPLLFENAYGDNSAIHNYYLLPFMAPFTLLFGGKGLFMAAYFIWLWAWFFWSKILKQFPPAAGLGFLLIVFGPTAFYQWDNPHFGWHAENYYYPLLLLFSAALLLKNKPVSLLAGLMIILNREDGIVLAAGIFIPYLLLYRPLSKETIRYVLLTGITAGIIFAGGLLLLQAKSVGYSRTEEALDRFRQAFSASEFLRYITKEIVLWFILIGTSLLPIFGWLKPKGRFVWILFFLILIMGINFMAAAYYFPDTKYGINWAPRISGTYGWLCGILLMVFYRPPLSERMRPDLLVYGLLIFVVQLFAPIGHKQQPYSFGDRLKRAFFMENRKLPDVRERQKLAEWFSAISPNHPIRTEELLFSMADKADYCWPDTLRKPYKEPLEAILFKNRRVEDNNWIPADSTNQFMRYIRKTN